MSNQPNPNVFFRGEDMGIGNFPIKGGTINDGGPAFPHTTQWDGITPAINYHGISMRDYFAAKAINEVGWYENMDNSAAMAYLIADAMLKARGEAK
jgi:hypothetical protein